MQLADHLNRTTNDRPQRTVVVINLTRYSTFIYNENTQNYFLRRADICYNNVRRNDSVTQILFRLGLPSFNTVLNNCKAIFTRTWLNSSNSTTYHTTRYDTICYFNITPIGVACRFCGAKNLKIAPPPRQSLIPLHDALRRRR